MPLPQQPPPLPAGVDASVYLWIEGLILAIVLWMIYLAGLRAIDTVSSLISPYVTACSPDIFLEMLGSDAFLSVLGSDAFLRMLGLAPVPQPLPRYKRVLKFLRGMFPGGKTKPVEKTLSAWILQNAKDIGVPILQKAIGLLSAHFTAICMVVILALVWKRMHSLDAKLRKIQQQLADITRKAVLSEERLVGLIMELLQRLDELQGRRRGYRSLPLALTAPGPSPGQPPRGLISRAGNFVTGFAADRIAEATSWARGS